MWESWSLSGCTRKKEKEVFVINKQYFDSISVCVHLNTNDAHFARKYALEISILFYFMSGVC